MKSSAKRPEGERRALEEYNRVKDKYPRKGRGSGIRNKWYPGGLFVIASALGKKAEYEVFVALFNGCVHSSALAVGRGPVVSAEHVLALASKIAARVARLNSQHNQIDLGESYERMLDVLCRDSLQ